MSVGAHSSLLCFCFMLWVVETSGRKKTCGDNLETDSSMWNFVLVATQLLYKRNQKSLSAVCGWSRVFWGLGQPVAQGQPGRLMETMKIIPYKKQQSHDVGHHVRISVLGLGQPEPVMSSHEQPRAAIGNPKTSDLAESVRKNIIIQIFPPQESGECITPGY